MPTIDFEVICNDCGKELESSLIRNILYVTPCLKCIEKAEMKGYDNGYDDGMDIE